MHNWHLKVLALSELAEGILLTLYVQKMEACKVEESLAIEGNNVFTLGH
jgi:hypothetical protein